jgi:transposase
VDATTLEANAAMRSIVRRDTGEGYNEFLTKLAKASGIENPQREDLAKLDRKRPKKGSNKEWEHPHDPDARITKMKDGRTHLAHKAEHAVDMETGAVVAVTMQGADKGDTQTLMDTLAHVAENLSDLPLKKQPLQEVVADKGYHCNETASALAELDVRSYLSEFAHCYETGAMRRTHLRGQENILKRILVHVAGCNLGLLMRRNFGFGTPRGLSELFSSLLSLIFRIHDASQRLWQPLCQPQNVLRPILAAA